MVGRTVEANYTRRLRFTKTSKAIKDNKIASKDPPSLFSTVVVGDDEGDGTEDANTRKMYNAPKHNIEMDSSGNMIREYDKSNKRTSLINDEVRVYKGGSWKDREYWLDPAQRRYYPQNMATDYIGFRCAMSRVGSKSKGNRKTKN